MSATTAQQRDRSLSSDARLGKMGDGDQVRGRSTSSVDRQSANSNGSNGGAGILCNAHEKPRRSSKNDSGIRSTLKAAFVPPQPGKQSKTNGKPLGKTFRREQPLPQSHAGGEVLKVDPRGPNAHVGDGIVLESPGAEESDGEHTSPGVASADSASPGSAVEYLSPPPETTDGSTDGGRSRSNTASTELSDTGSSSKGSNPCSIKFAPLPSSGRLKRANSITIGVAARSQLLHSQGAGRQQYNAGFWQQAQQQQQLVQRQRQQQQQQPRFNQAARYSGFQADDTVDLGEEIWKGARKAWNRVRSGGSVSSASDDGGSRERPDAVEDRSKVFDEAVVEEEAEGHEAAGEKTPKRAQSPTHMSKLKDDEEHEPEGARTPRHSMQRRVSTGTFFGQASFREIEEKRKRGEATDGGEFGDDEGQNEATRFIEKLGQTGAGKEAFHIHGQGGGQIKRDGKGKIVEVVGLDDGDSSTSSRGDTTRDEDEDDAEEQEAQRLAEQALKGHSAKANKAGAVEKMEKKRP